MNADRDRLLEILDAIDHVERYNARGKDAFARDEMVRDASLYRIGRLARAVRSLSPTLKDLHAHVGWHDVDAMNEVANRGCTDADIDVVWRMVSHDLLAFRILVRAILEMDTAVRA